MDCSKTAIQRTFCELNLKVLKYGNCIVTDHNLWWNDNSVYQIIYSKFEILSCVQTGEKRYELKTNDNRYALVFQLYVMGFADLFLKHVKYSPSGFHFWRESSRIFQLKFWKNMYFLEVLRIVIFWNGICGFQKGTVLTSGSTTGNGIFLLNRKFENMFVGYLTFSVNEFVQNSFYRNVTIGQPLVHFNSL